ncbi:hypothetical protein ACIPEN_12040 [Herbaspirillum chlorophenolicum]|uniref:Transmembrane protein n=1 Tax=Herbaspirillum chlorophenolicum TaxID=211589 RepID=A0ABW8EZT5_9BURK
MKAALRYEEHYWEQCWFRIEELVMHQPDSLIPHFARMLTAGIGWAIAMPVVPAHPAAPADRDRRRSHSAHEPAVKQASSDNEIGRGIIEDDARKLAAQNKTVRKNERDKQARKLEAEMDQALADTFPASDPIDRSSGP